MKSRTTSSFRPFAGGSRQTLRERITAALLIPIFGVAFLSPAMLSTAMAVGPEAGEIGLPENATPEQVLDRLCDELKMHPEQSIDLAKWSVAYFQSQIRTTPAFASALAIIFADCLSQSNIGNDGKMLVPVAQGPLDALAERIADTLIALIVAMNYLPPGSPAVKNMIPAALAALDPALAALVLQFLNEAMTTGVLGDNSDGDSVYPRGGQGELFKQLQELIEEAKSPSPSPTPSATPSMTPLPTPTPPVTPVLNS